MAAVIVCSCSAAQRTKSVKGEKARGGKKRNVNCRVQTHFSVDTSAGEFVLDDHDDDAEHSHDEGVVADPFAFLEQRFPPAQPVADVRFVFARRSSGADVAAGADAVPLAEDPFFDGRRVASAATAAPAAAFATLDGDQRDGRLLTA